MTPPRVTIVVSVEASRAEATAAFVAELEAAGVRVAIFAGDLRDEADRAALHEMTAELFPAPSK